MGLALLACATLFTAYFAFPETRISRVPLNDVVFHMTASERLAASLDNQEPLLDSWVSEWSLGYPVWLSYQPLPHLVGAMVMRMGSRFAGPDALFAGLFYLMILALPASVYAGARLIGMGPPAAGLASMLVFASSATGDLGSYGLGYGSVVWRGSGLYTQIFALHFLVFSWGATSSALDSGKRSARAAASVLLALTALSHIIFGYVAFVSAALIAVAGPRSRWAERLVRLLSIVLPALLLVAWFVVPLLLRQEVVNHSRWEGPRKWDSYGAPFILTELVSGRFFDFGRAPVLSLLVAVGVFGAAMSYRENGARRLLILCGSWLILFFGRETWGRLVSLAGVPGDLQMHRLQAAFELSAILLSAFGLAHCTAWANARGRRFGLACASAIAVAMVWIGSERAVYLKQNQAWGEENLAAYQAQRSDIEATLADVRQILAERPGRVSAGLAASWGKEFRIGQVPVYAFLSRHHIDQASFLYHSMSKTSDVMVLRDEANPAHDVAFGIRGVIAPAGRSMPPHLHQRSVHGAFAVYESSPEGYFGIVDVNGYYDGPHSTAYEPEAAWLSSPLLTLGRVVSLDPRNPSLPVIHRWNPLPVPSRLPGTPLQGRIIEESKTGETYRARIEVNRPAYAFVKITWNPDLTATVDRLPASLFHVTPGFGAVPVPAGQHEVEIRYTPGTLRSVLFVLGLASFIGVWLLLGRPIAARLEATASARLAPAAATLLSPSRKAAAALILVALVALHPLFRGKSIGGHDAAAYPPRLVEMAKVLVDGHFPPIWAPDLSAGHGQPLFEFNPPLVYWIALPFRAIGLGLADSLQFGLVLLFLLGAAAVYRIGRQVEAPRYAALGGAVSWLFAPYVSLDLFVRSAFAEAAAVAVAPIALWALLAAVKRPNAARVACGSTAIAMVLLAHSAVALLFVPGLLLVAVVYGITLSRVNLSRVKGADPPTGMYFPLIGGLAAIVGAIGLSAFFWIPSLSGISNLHASRLLENGFEWRSHILSPVQLLWVRWGYGLSVPGTGDGMSFSLGPAHLIFAVAGMWTVMRSRHDTRRSLAIVFGALALSGAFVAVQWSAPVWAQASLLQHLIYPWRALFLPAMFLPLLAIFEFERAGPRLTMLLAGVLIAINLAHTEPQKYLTYDDEYYAPESLATRGINTATHEEFEPRWSEKRPPYSPDPLTAISGSIQVTQISRRTASQEYVVTTSQNTQVESSTFYYPGWTLHIDGNLTPISPVAARGTMQFEIPPGEHRVKLELRPTFARGGSLALSIASFAVLAAAVLLDGSRKGRTA